MVLRRGSLKPDLVKTYTSVLVKGAHGTLREEDVTQGKAPSFPDGSAKPFSAY